MTSKGSSLPSGRASQKQLQLFIAVFWGALLGGLTFSVGTISTISANPIIGAVQILLMTLIVPGLIGSMAFVGNAHAFSLLPGAVINGLLHFVACWLLIGIRARFKSRANVLALGLLVVFGASVTRGQTPELDVFQNAKHLYQIGHLAEAEQRFRELTNHDPSNVAVQMYLGQTLFREEKFSDAIGPYEKVRAMEQAGTTKLTLKQHRILGDQLAMAYGISGRSSDSKALLKELIRTDPEYPLNYYNLACVAADEEDKPSVLKNLELALQHKDQILQGEEMPDPASDPSFKKYTGDGDFKSLLARWKK